MVEVEKSSRPFQSTNLELHCSYIARAHRKHRITRAEVDVDLNLVCNLVTLGAVNGLALYATIYKV